MELIPLSFEEYLQQRYAVKTRKDILIYLRRVSREVGDPERITIDEVEDYYWNYSKRSRNKAVKAIRRYKEFRRYQEEAAQALISFFEGA